MKYLAFVLMTLLLTQCKPEPQPIAYNVDECAFCKMKISDPNFGAELVTDKGKVFKYDSAECLLREYNNNEDVSYAHVMVTDYMQPHTLINGLEAYYLISENLPSPMGGNLSCYENEQDAVEKKNKLQGEIYSFNEMVELYKDN